MNINPKSFCYGCDLPLSGGSLLVCSECLNVECQLFAEATEELEIPDFDLEEINIVETV